MDTNLWQMVRNYAVCTFPIYYPTDLSKQNSLAMLDQLVEFTRDWQPDLVVWDPLFFPAPIAARDIGAAHARLLWGLDRFGWIRARFQDWLNESGTGQARVDLMAESMGPVLDQYGQEFDDELLVGQRTIDPTPPEMRLPTKLDYISVRPVPYSGSASVPDWLMKPAQRPRIRLTLGTSGRDLFGENEISITEVLQATADMDVEVVATLNSVQLAGVDSIPENVRVVEYVPLNLLLATCSAVIHLGGTGTLATAVDQGVPQILIPKEGSEYVDFANYVASRGAGLVISRQELTSKSVKDNLAKILEDKSFQGGIKIIQDEMAAMPSPLDIVPTLENLTGRHRTKGAGKVGSLRA